MLPMPDSPFLPLHNEFEASAEAARAAHLRVGVVCSALTSADDLDGEIERQLMTALSERRRALALVGSCVLRLLAAGQIQITKPVEPENITKPEHVEPPTEPEHVEPPASSPVVETPTPALELPPFFGNAPEVSSQNVLENVLGTFHQLDVLATPILEANRFNAVVVGVQDMVQYTDQWAILDQNTQRALVGLVAAVARHLQDETDLDSSALLPLNSIFSRLTAFSATYRPGFVRGLTRSHGPYNDTWMADIRQWYRELTHTDTTAAPRVWTSKPADPPPAVEDDEDEPEPLNPERSLSALRHLLDADEPDRDLVCKAAMVCIDAGVRPTDPRLLRMLGMHLELLTKEPSLKNLRKAIRESQKEAEEEARKDNSTPPSDWPYWAYTRGKRLLILGGDVRNTTTNRLQKVFGFSEILWETGHQTRRVQAAVTQVSAGSIDMVLFLARFVSHAAWDVAVPACKAAKVPFVLVESGYGTAQIRAAMEQTLSGFSPPE